MDVSIIFVNYKTKNLTINAIQSVKDKTEGLEYEIFVVDNDSQDGSIEAIEKEFQDINIIKNPVNLGFGSANNIAIKQASGKYILCLNTDTLLVNNAIKIMFDFMERAENKKVGACGGYITDKDNQPAQCGGNYPSLLTVLWKFGLRNVFKNIYHKHFDSCIFSNENNFFKNIYIIGADLFLRKSVLDKIGLFDENIFMYFEEVDLCKRIKKSGYEIEFVEDAIIIHLEGKSPKNEFKKKVWFKNSEFYYFKKHYPNQVWLIKLTYTILYLVDWIVLRHKDSKALLKLIMRNKTI